ncbi:MAG TPA: NAD(P)-dependent oxidoreductase, partial [Thermomicrobiales bacterium]|nr:NAD(P)-dependent oxidoreductase [Thermomicrobiales bacterium]
MARKVKVVVTSDRYGSETTGLELERELVQEFPELDIELVGAPSESEDQLIEVGQGADALLVSTREAVTRRVLENIPNVKVISRYGVGLDNVDLDAAADVGIVVTHYPGYCTSEVADHAMALMLAINRRIVELDRDLHEGAWVKYGSATGGILRGPIPPLRQMTLGIVGFGRIGQAVADRARGFGLTLLVADPYVAPDVVEANGATLLPLDELLPQADYITLHA